jgi:hypothetical protein
MERLPEPTFLKDLNNKEYLEQLLRSLRNNLELLEDSVSKLDTKVYTCSILNPSGTPTISNSSGNFISTLTLSSTGVLDIVLSNGIVKNTPSIIITPLDTFCVSKVEYTSETELTVSTIDLAGTPTNCSFNLLLTKN